MAPSTTVAEIIHHSQVTLTGNFVLSHSYLNCVNLGTVDKNGVSDKVAVSLNNI